MTSSWVQDHVFVSAAVPLMGKMHLTFTSPSNNLMHRTCLDTSIIWFWSLRGLQETTILSFFLLLVLNPGGKGWNTVLGASTAAPESGKFYRCYGNAFAREKDLSWFATPLRSAVKAGTSTCSMPSFNLHSAFHLLVPRRFRCSFPSLVLERWALY